MGRPKNSGIPVPRRRRFCPPFPSLNWSGEDFAHREQKPILGPNLGSGADMSGISICLRQN